MRRRRADPPPPPPWALLSYALRYPEPGRRDELAREVAALPGGPVRALLERFVARQDQSAFAARPESRHDRARRHRSLRP